MKTTQEVIDVLRELVRERPTTHILSFLQVALQLEGKEDKADKLTEVLRRGSIEALRERGHISQEVGERI